jgi:hypothetical protein
MWEYPTANKESPITKEVGLLLHFINREKGRKDAKGRLGGYFIFEPRKGTEYTEVFSGEACLTWFLEFETCSLKPLGWVFRLPQRRGGIAVPLR